MKIALVALSGALLLSSAAFAKDVTSTIKVSGWHCEGCSGKTADAVKQIDGVKTADADLDHKTLTVTYDDTRVSEAQIEKVITDLHYKVAK